MSDAIDIAQFRLDFPEFTDTTKYPDSQIQFWSGIGDLLLNVVRWGTFRDHGLRLFTAHNIALAAQAAAQGTAGAVPGTGNGLVASESAGPLSVSVDNQASIELDAGNYNLTTYGSMFLRLARIVGTGGWVDTPTYVYSED